MKWPPGYRVEPLDLQDRTVFSCGKPSLDRYLKTQVGQDRKRDLTRCYVLIHADNPQRILAYYTLSSAAVHSSTLPEGHRLPYTEVPCLLLGRLARDESVRGSGLGRGLLLHVLSETARLAAEVGIFALLVDALDEEAALYYQNWDFTPLEGNRLFLTVKDIRATIQELGQISEDTPVDRFRKRDVFVSIRYTMIDIDTPKVLQLKTAKFK